MFNRIVQLIQQPISRFASWLATVTAVDVGKKDDGLVPFQNAGTDLDKTWYDLQQEFSDALEAWRKNPIARRLISLTTAYVVGGEGIRVQASHYSTLDNYIRKLWNHPKNNILLKQGHWCDELSRAGELFPILFHNPADGLAYIRMMPASRIERIEWQEGDYETELYYYEVSDTPGEDGKRWLSPSAPEAQEHKADGSLPPVMLHYAVNRPVGAVRGESDLAPILPWLKRYSRWLEDRVRLNSAVRAFLWVVKVASGKVKEKEQKYRKPPEAGSVVVVEEGGEEWEAVTPNLHARDASADGRMIRWMIVSGGPGIGLTDIGEAETANLATATAMGEQRRRFLRRRQAYFAWIMQDITIQAWNRAINMNVQRGRVVDTATLQVLTPDVAPQDNEQLSQAASQITDAMATITDLMEPSETLRRLTLRLLLKFADETITDEEFEKIVTPQAFAGSDEAGATYANGHHGVADGHRKETTLAN